MMRIIERNRAKGRPGVPYVLGIAGLLLALCGQAPAATYRLPPPGNDIVGKVSIVNVQEGEALIDIARDHGLGFAEIVAANPGLDPWLPPTGAEVVLPTRYILPSAPREGIIVNISEMRLYYYPPRSADGSGFVLTFPIGIGREGWSTPIGTTRIVAKAERPSWVVPASVRAEYAEAGTPLPAVVPPGPENPLGGHALRLGMTSYLIHGSNKPFGIGMRVSHGCIRMYNRDVERLFHMVPVGTPVWIIDQPHKLGREDGRLYLESHEPVTEPDRPPVDHLPVTLAAIAAVTLDERVADAHAAATDIAARRTGLPEPVGDFYPVERSLEAGGWMLQFGAFSDRSNASRVAGTLAALGARVSVQARSANGYCHVLIGPYEDRDAAREALEGYREATGFPGELLPANRPDLLSECVL